MAKLDLGDGARTEISNVSGIPSIVITGAHVTTVAVGVIHSRSTSNGVVTSGMVDNAGTVGAKGEGIGLGSKGNGSPRCGVEEQIGIVGRVLSLNETIKLAVIRGLLAEDGISEARRICGEVGRGVLLSLAVLDGGSDHLGFGGGIELTGSVWNPV